MTPMHRRGLLLDFSKSKLAGESITGRELPCSVRRANDVTLNLNLSPLVDSQNEQIGVTVVTDDVTEKRRFETVKNLFGRFVSRSKLGTASLAFRLATRFATCKTVQPRTALRRFTMLMQLPFPPRRPM